MPPFTESGWAELENRVSSLEAGQRMIAASNVQLVDQMAEITVNQHRANEVRRQQTQRLDEIALTLLNQDEEIRRNRDRLAEIGEELRTNTRTTAEILEATRDLRDVVITAKTGGRLARWAAPTLLAAAASIGVIKGWWLASVEWLQK